ncbi:hypothetical protein D3C76_1074320 [compost metagenome]
MQELIQIYTGHFRSFRTDITRQAAKSEGEAIFRNRCGIVFCCRLLRLFFLR